MAVLGVVPSIAKVLIAKVLMIMSNKWDIWSFTGNDFFDWFWNEGSWWPY